MGNFQLSHQRAKFDPYRSGRGGDVIFLFYFFMSDELLVARSKLHLTWWEEPLTLSVHSTRFDGCRSCGSGDVAF